MKHAILLSLVAASGLLFANDMNTQKMDSHQKISGRERIALETSSPRVHVAKKNHESKSGRMDRVVSDKTTVNAFVPVGK